MSRSEPPKTKRKKALYLALGAAALIGVSAAVTVVVEHRVHGHDPESHAELGHVKEGLEQHDHGEPGQHTEGKIKLTAAMLQNAKISVRTAAAGKVTVALSLPGEVTLNSEKVAHVSPRVGGSVREAKKQLGDVVKKGDVLAVLDSRELADMQRDALSAKERLELAQTNFKRQEQLWNEKISAEKEYLSAKQALAEAKIEHRAASQKLAAGAGARSSGGGLVLSAPLDGTVIEKHAVVGEVLNNETLAFVIADLSTLWVNVTVYAKDLPRIHVGQPALVRAEGVSEPARGVVSYIDRVVGEQTRSANARVVLEGPSPKWRPGLFATAEISLEEVDAPVVVAHEAVQRVASKDVVFVQEGDFFEPRPVTVGRQGFGNAERELFVEIVQGIVAGTQYAAENSFILKAELGKSEAGHDH